MIILMDPPEHRQMRSLVNKVFTPRAIETLKPMVTETIDRSSAGRPEQLRRRAGLLRLLPGGSDHPDARRAGRPPAAGPQWVDASLHREPGQIEMSQKGMQAVAKSMGLYYNLIQERRAEPQDDMFSRAVAAEIEREDGDKQHVSTTSRSQDSQRFWAARAPRPSPS